MKKIILFFVLSCSFTFGQNPIDKLTLHSFYLGIKEIGIHQTSNDLTYSFNTFKKGYINVTLLDVKRFKVKYSNNTYFLTDELDSKTNNKYSITVDSQKSISTITTPHYTGEMILTEQLTNDYHFVFLYLFLSELHGKSDMERIDYNSYLSTGNRLGCSFWNTYYSVGIGISDAGALSHLNYTANQALHAGDLNGCTLLSTKPEFSSHFGVHMATIAWCCP